MKLAVVGSRSFSDYNRLKAELDKYPEKITEIISGGARGADTLAAKWANETNIPLTVFLPNWDKYGKSAGYKRNKQIVDAADAILAFWDGYSSGTYHTISLAEESNKLCGIIAVNNR